MLAELSTGIWTKHIKAKTELHQTVIDRCLKSLTQKQLVKALKGTVQVRDSFCCGCAEPVLTVL